MKRNRLFSKKGANYRQHVLIRQRRTVFSSSNPPKLAQGQCCLAGCAAPLQCAAEFVQQGSECPGTSQGGYLALGCPCSERESSATWKGAWGSAWLPCSRVQCIGNRQGLPVGKQDCF